MHSGRYELSMAARSHAEDRRSDTEIKFYLPAGVQPSDTTRFERLWASLSTKFGFSSE